MADSMVDLSTGCVEKHCGRKEMKSILDYILSASLHSEQSVEVFKEELLQGTKLYFDGLIEQRDLIQDWGEAKSAFTHLLACTRIAVVDYFQGKTVPVDEILALLEPHIETYLAYASNKGKKSGRFKNKNVRTFRSRLQQLAFLEKREVVVPIASGGFEPGIVAADYFGIEEIYPVRFSRIKCHDDSVHAPLPFEPCLFSGKNVLLVDEINETELTKEAVMEWVAQFYPRSISYVSIF